MHTDNFSLWSLFGGKQTTLLQRWAWLIFFSILVFAISSISYYAVQLSVRRNVDSKLKAILETEIKAISLWSNQQLRDLTFLVDQSDVRALAQVLVDDQSKLAAGTPSVTAAQDNLDAILQRTSNAFGYFDYRLIDVDRVILVDRQQSEVGSTVTDQWEPYQKVIQTGRPTLASISRSHFSIPNQSRQESEFLLVGPIKDLNENVIAVVAFGVPLNKDFAEILSVARAGDTGETFAFDVTGERISESRFVSEIVELDDKNAPQALTALVKRAVDQFESDPRSSQVTGVSGEILDGYLDYRGKKAVGVYQWLPEYGFGIVTKLDFEEAYAPGLLLLKIFQGFFAISLLAIAVNVINTRRLSRYQTQMAKAQQHIRRMGQYTLQDRIGSGGMGEVYRASHAMLRRPTAIKLLRPDRSSEAAVARFEQEVQYTAMLTHPNTIAIYDFGRTSDGTFYYAMEYLDGLDLGRVVREHGPLPAGRVIYILRQVCNSLSEAHEAGLVHRDIKPANVIVVRRGRRADIAKVLDFGLVWDVDQNTDNRVIQLAGTPAYMSPESFVDPANVTAQSDLYGVGALGYFLLTGTDVFEGDNIDQFLSQHQTRQPETPLVRLGRSVDRELSDLLMQCLKKDPSDRPSSAAELSKRLTSCTVATSWTRADAEAWWDSQSSPTIGSGKAVVPTDDQVTVTQIMPARNLT